MCEANYHQQARVAELPRPHMQQLELSEVCVQSRESADWLLGGVMHIKINLA